MAANYFYILTTIFAIASFANPSLLFFALGFSLAGIVLERVQGGRW
jgi:hypothetical protein